jgi:hypothetical protein
VWVGINDEGALSQERRLLRSGHIVGDITVLLLEPGYNHHYGFDKPGLLGTLSARAAFAPEHAWTDGPGQDNSFIGD